MSFPLRRKDQPIYYAIDVRWTQILEVGLTSSKVPLLAVSAECVIDDKDTCVVRDAMKMATPFW